MAKTALIIGGTKGLGLSLAWEAQRREIWPMITGRSVHKSASKFPPNCGWKTLDLTNWLSVEDFFEFYNCYDYVVWNAGELIEKPFKDFTLKELLQMTLLHYVGPIEFLRNLITWQREYEKSFHLITISSTSSWRIRDNQAVYCSLQAAKSAFTSNLSRELARDLPGSKTTLFHPGGMKTRLFKGTKTDTSNFMDTDEVAKIIWNEVENQRTPFHEVQIMRNDDGSPNVSYGPRMPESPFGEEV